jgi:predicted TIM-barrel fold metal-dependent hydrolase
MPRLAVLVLAAGLVAPTAAAQAPTVAADHHQHFFSPTIAARSPTLPPTDAKRLVGLLDDAGITQAVVLSLAYSYGNPNRPPVEHEYDLVKAENDWTSAQVALAPDRLRAFCSVNPLKEYALEEIARCAKDPRLRLGLKLHFGNSDVDLARPEHARRLREVFAAANRHRMAIAVHMRSNLSQQRPYGAAYARTFLEQLLPAALDVPVQIAHLAGAGGFDDPLVDEALGVFVTAIATNDPRMKPVWFDVSGVAGLGEWKAKAPRIAARIREVGIARILYGSDGAGGGNLVPADAWKAFAELPLTPAELKAIASNVAPYLR